MEHRHCRSRSHLLRRRQQSLFLYGSGRDTYAYSNRNAYANGNTHPNADTYPNANSLAHRNANADADFSMHCS